MRLHSNNPGAIEEAIRAAVAGLPGVAIEGLTSHGSRSRACGLELALSGGGRYGGQYGGGGYTSATWDEWGAVLAAAFDADEEACRTRGDIFAAGMTAGPYESAEHFRWATADRYDRGMPLDAHAAHRWEVAEVVTGRYNVQTCRRCSAVIRRILFGAFAEINN